MDAGAASRACELAEVVAKSGMPLPPSRDRREAREEPGDRRLPAPEGPTDGHDLFRASPRIDPVEHARASGAGRVRTSRRRSRRGPRPTRAPARPRWRGSSACDPSSSKMRSAAPAAFEVGPQIRWGRQAGSRAARCKTRNEVEPAGAELARRKDEVAASTRAPLDDGGVGLHAERRPTNDRDHETPLAYMARVERTHHGGGQWRATARSARPRKERTDATRMPAGDSSAISRCSLRERVLHVAREACTLCGAARQATAPSATGSETTAGITSVRHRWGVRRRAANPPGPRP
jgi:hypothetical protein